MEKINFEQKLVLKEVLPLYRKRILFTTPRNYAGTLSKLLVERGARLVWMPTIEIWPMPDYSELDQAIDNLSSYAWVAFTSENGIEAFFNRLYAKGLSTEAVKVTKLAALGADALALEKRGVKADLVPPEASPRGTLNELVRLGVHSGRVLVPVPEVIGVKEPYVVPEFVEGLKSIGMTVHRIPVYQTVAVTEGVSVEKRMLLGGEIDLVIITSSAEIYSLLSLLGDEREVLNRTPLAYPGKYTAKTATEVGLNADIVPEKYSWLDLIGAIEGYFQTEAKKTN
jgi:uroporphyrinogen-III synthase